MDDHPQSPSKGRQAAASTVPASDRDGAAQVEDASASQRHWRWTVRLALGLMLVWTVVTFGVGFWAREWSFQWFGWPFSFWMGAQGALLVYLALVAFYAWAMRRLDRACGFEEG